MQMDNRAVEETIAAIYLAKRKPDPIYRQDKYSNRKVLFIQTPEPDCETSLVCKWTEQWFAKGPIPRAADQMRENWPPICRSTWMGLGAI